MPNNVHEIEKIADVADFIVNGYAFTQNENQVRVINLHKPQSARVLSENGELLETSMDDIEQEIVIQYFHKNSKHLKYA